MPGPVEKCIAKEWLVGFPILSRDRKTVGSSDVGEVEHLEMHTYSVDATEADTGEELGGFFHYGDIMEALGRDGKGRE